MDGQQTNGATRALHPTAGVVVVDPQRVVGEALASAVAGSAGFHVLGVATTVAEALALVSGTSPDVVITESWLPDGDGSAVTKDVLRLRPRTRVIVLTGDVTSERVLAAAECGACGFVSKRGSVEELVHAMSTARQGGMVVAASTLAESLSREAGGALSLPRPRLGLAGTPTERSDTTGHVRLTTREREVLELFADGYDVPAASRALGITVNTCRGYVKALHTKLGAHSQLEAVAVARRTGLLPTG